MTFAEKLKALRSQAGFSQEKLAEKLGVSRQAVTKWETEAGIPDIENVKAISVLFHISIDELLQNDAIQRETEFLFESVTEYDIEKQKRIDMKLGGANRIVLAGGNSEKLVVRLASNTISTVQNDFKVKIDDTRSCIDVNVVRKNDMTEAAAKEGVTVFVTLPTPFRGKVELAANANTVEVNSFECEEIELDIKTRDAVFTEFKGGVEINCNLDMNIVCNTLCGSVEVNQTSATSRLGVKEGIPFTATCKGIGTAVFYEKNGARVAPFSVENSENSIELNGLKSELIIYII